MIGTMTDGKGNQNLELMTPMACDTSTRSPGRKESPTIPTSIQIWIMGVGVSGEGSWAKWNAVS